mgnify:CR=1 FL=1
MELGNSVETARELLAKVGSHFREANGHRSVSIALALAGYTYRYGALDDRMHYPAVRTTCKCN